VLLPKAIYSCDTGDYFMFPGKRIVASKLMSHY